MSTFGTLRRTLVVGSLIDPRARPTTVVMSAVIALVVTAVTLVTTVMVGLADVPSTGATVPNGRSVLVGAPAFVGDDGDRMTMVQSPALPTAAVRAATAAWGDQAQPQRRALAAVSGEPAIGSVSLEDGPTGNLVAGQAPRTAQEIALTSDVSTPPGWTSATGSNSQCRGVTS